MELSHYLALLRRWLWLVIIVGFIFGIITYIQRISEPVRYRAQATISIGNAYASPNPDASSLRLGQDLTLTYQRLIRTREVLQGVVDELDLPFGANRINGMMSVRSFQGTSLMEITVTHTDPILTAEIANEIAQQLILKGPSNLTEDQQQQVDILDEEISTQRQQLQTLRDELSSINASLLAENITSEEQASLLEQRNNLIDQINQASNNLAILANTAAGFQQRTNSVEVVETAQIATEAIRPQVLSASIASAVLGGGLAFAGVVLYEYFNETYRTADEVIKDLELPVLGVISKFGKRGDTYADRLITNVKDSSQLFEQYNTLRSNLLFTVAQNRVFVLTSSMPAEGKSVTASNLSLTIALSGLRVLLIDADLRRPTVHKIWQMDNEIGLSNLLTAPQSNESLDSDEVIDENYWVKTIRKTDISNLHIMTSGKTVPNPSAFLGSMIFKNWMEIIKKSGYFNVIIFDAPPVLTVSDASELAGTVGARTLLIVSANSTHRVAAIKARERFDNLELPVTGVILTKVNLRDETYYSRGHYRYYYRMENPAQTQ